MELKLDHPQGAGQLHEPSSFIYILAPGGCVSEPQQCVCSVHLACKTRIIHYILPVKWGILLLFPSHFSSAGKRRVVARTWLFTFTSWCVHIITWLEELRPQEKHQMFICPEIKLWDLAALLLGVPAVGEEGTPRLLLMQISVLKMTSLIQPRIRASYPEQPQIRYHAMPRKGWLGAAAQPPSGAPLGDRFVAEPTYTGQGIGVKLALRTFLFALLSSLWDEKRVAFQTPVAFGAQVKNSLMKEQMEVADSQQMAQSRVGTSHRQELVAGLQSDFGKWVCSR